MVRAATLIAACLVAAPVWAHEDGPPNHEHAPGDPEGAAEAPAPDIAPPDAAGYAEILRKMGDWGFATHARLKEDILPRVEGLVDYLHRQTGAKAYLVILNAAYDVTPYLQMYQLLEMSGPDVLIISNPSRWVILSDYIPAAEAARLGAIAANPDRSLMDRLRNIIEGAAVYIAIRRAGGSIAQATPSADPVVTAAPAPPPAPPRERGAPAWIGMLIGLAAAGLGFVAGRSSARTSS